MLQRIGRVDARRVYYLLIGAWGAALLVRLVLLFLLHDAPYVAGMAQGDVAYGIVSGQGLVHGSLPGCGIALVQNAQHRLIDVEDYLKNYEPWCEELGLGGKSARPMPFISAMMPGPGILLAGTHYAFGSFRYIYLQAILAVLDSLGVFLVFSIGLRYFSIAVALLASFLYALFLPIARLAIAGGIRDAWMPIILLAALFAFLKGSDGSSSCWRWFGAAGFLLGAGCYFRPTVLLLPVFWASLLFVTRRFSSRRICQALIVMLVPLILLLSPWWVRNYIVFDRFIPTYAGFWMATWQGLGEYANPVGAVLKDEVVYQQYLDAGGFDSYFSPRFTDDYFRPKVLRAIRDEPMWYLSVLFRRVISLPVQVYDWGYDSSTLPLLPRRVFFRGSTALLFALAAIGLSMNRRRLGETLLISSVTLYNILVHLPILTWPRYILPGNASLLLFAAFALVGMWNCARSSRWNRAFYPNESLEP
jgi:4-amino-4-deoxy-L-arabinose transferase-like glycosyltransferase